MFVAGLVEVMTTGGIPPGIAEACSAERVYNCLYQRVLQQNRKYYNRFPGTMATECSLFLALLYIFFQY
jgi:hypothetical protein